MKQPSTEERTTNSTPSWNSSRKRISIWRSVLDGIGKCCFHQWMKLLLGRLLRRLGIRSIRSCRRRQNPILLWVLMLSQEQVRWRRRPRWLNKKRNRNLTKTSATNYKSLQEIKALRVRHNRRTVKIKTLLEPMDLDWIISTCIWR